MMIVKRFSGGRDIDEKKVGVAGVAGGGTYLAANKRDIKSKLTGRKELYHTTPSENVPGILEKGLQGSKALDPNSATNVALDGAGTKDGRKLVYTGKNRMPGKGMERYYKSRGKKTKTVKISMSVDDYNKLKFTDNNPEFLGASDADDWLKRRHKKSWERDDKFFKKHPNNRINGMTRDQYKEYHFKRQPKAGFGDKMYFNAYSGKKNSSTRIIEGDIESRHIIGGKGYKKLSAKEIAGYVKKHPKRFAKGVGKTAIGATAVVGGTALALKNKNKKRVS